MISSDWHVKLADFGLSRIQASSKAARTGGLLNPLADSADWSSDSEEPTTAVELRLDDNDAEEDGSDTGYQELDDGYEGLDDDALQDSGLHHTRLRLCWLTQFGFVFDRWLLLLDTHVESRRQRHVFLVRIASHRQRDARR